MKDCEQVQSEWFYLAEDDGPARRNLEQHLSRCSDCSREWQSYRAVLEVYDSAESGPPPALRVIRESPRPWRLIRIAAVLAFVLLLARYGMEPRMQQPPSPTQRNSASRLEWEMPEIEYSKYPIRVENRDFQEQVNYLRESIAVLQNEASPERF